ncbi:MAG TPA: diaminopimelate decarboxylase [Methylomirabilota bacterium]|jgi:diaminopimelate decarboxylase|nr:diaminopimelate decarboxylase [Methylomirabilota bacterium]
MTTLPALGRTLFLTAEQAAEVRDRFGTPCYVYNRAILEAAARAALAFPAPYGFTLRYAMKANPSLGVLSVFRDLGLHIDASSDFEVARALRAGFTPAQIQLTSQMPSRRLVEFVGRGVLYNACSLHQLEQFGKAAPGGAVSVRMNPGLGSGATNRTNTGGPASSFGVWHAYLDEVKKIAARHTVRITRLHTHIGSGSDPEVWKRVTRMTLDLAAQLPDVTVVNLGGGFKVGRMPDEPSTDLQDVGLHVRRELEAFREREGRALHLEIEPGTYLVARAGAIVATCVDVVDTGTNGYLFAKLDTGMPEVTRPSLYGAQHPIDVLADGRKEVDVVFVGPCCESGDILTPAPGNPEALAPRRAPHPEIGDLVVVGGAGAYCAGMATINYNSYPQAPEVMLEPDGTFRLLRRRQLQEQMWLNEVSNGG